MEDPDMIFEIEDFVPHAPVGLRIICVLSWSASLISVFLVLGLMLGGQSFVRWANFPVVDALIRDDAAGNLFYMVLKICLLAGSCFAVLQLWRLRKNGFWIFLSTEGLLLIIPLLFLSALSWRYLIVKLLISLIFTLFFVLLFSRYYKILK